MIRRYKAAVRDNSMWHGALLLPERSPRSRIVQYLFRDLMVYYVIARQKRAQVASYSIDSMRGWYPCHRFTRSIPMAASLPYLASNKNVGTLFEKIASAKIPPKFTYDFMQTTIGLKGTNDRSLITLLKNMGFLDQASTPTPSYALLKGDKRRSAVAAGIRQAYAPLFSANETANDLPSEKLKGLVAQVAGTDDDMTARIASTFSTLAKLGDFDTEAPVDQEKLGRKKEDEIPEHIEPVVGFKGLRSEFHYNLQIHLPANGTEETYMNIFNAIRKTFQ
jgi:hypothetical protein